MTQHFRYKFGVIVRRILSDGTVEEREDDAFFYANSEVEARAQYLETYGVEAGELKNREPW